MKQFRAIGLMSGTSMDGIDAAVIETDGSTHLRPDITGVSEPVTGGVRWDPAPTGICST
jgi:1,6-anhydro-N-acetylmuramate kinase